MVDYLNKYIDIHIPDKDIKENILKDNLVPANVKKPQVVDNYIKEYLTENKCTYIKTWEVLEGGSGKGVIYFGAIIITLADNREWKAIFIRVRGRGSPWNDRNFWFVWTNHAVNKTSISFSHLLL